MADDDSKVMTKGVFRSFVTDWYRKLKGAFNVEGTLTATKSDGTKAWELSQESAVLGTTKPAVRGTSQIGTADRLFGSVWAGNINNNPVTDSANPTLSVDGATSIVGALNQINSHLAVVYNNFFAPDYARLLHDSGEVRPTSTAQYSYTTPEHGFVCLSAWKEKGGYTLFVKVNGINLYKVPAYGTPACTISFPIFASQTTTISTDISSASWTCVLKVFGCIG